ncbi:MAG: DNA translocase FtsK 4TM domain-containing protein, partial [bacterium]
SKGKKKGGILSFFNNGNNHGGKEGPVEKISEKIHNLSAETKKGIFIIFLVVIGLLSFLGLFDLSGEFGRAIAWFLGITFGWMKWLFPILIATLVYFLWLGKYEVKIVNYIGGLMLILGLGSLSHLQYGIDGADAAAWASQGGGYIGAWLNSLLLLKYMGFWGALVVAIAIFLVGVLLTFETSIYGLMWPVRLFKYLVDKANHFFSHAKEKLKEVDDEDYEEENAEEVEAELEEAAEEEEEEMSQFKAMPLANAKPEVKEQVVVTEKVEEIAKPKKFGKKINIPFDVLTSKSGKPTSGDIARNQEIIKKTLSNFGIPLEMSDVHVGPTVTQYTFRPADGVKLSKIVTLNNDLSLALAAYPLRIEAPIPGKALVGIEIPNQIQAKVTMRDLLMSKEYKNRSNNLQMALGKDVSGNCIFARLDRMPHCLIAGATGSGKSVCINSIIVSLMYENSPDELKFILVDPKRVELPIYNGLPYLLTPVITDVKKTINSLKWGISEMERRFELLSKKGYRNIETFNQAEPNDKLPYIVYVIDELADLMGSAGADLEALIVRIAQMARAVGIHLILATQRPSVEVITGLIKANIPARIAFSVVSLMDSRTILDASGAEKLVGRGDMLYIGPETAKPKRIQGVFLADEEIKNVVDCIKKQVGSDFVDSLMVDKQASGGLGIADFSSADDGDDLLSEAKQVIREAGKASASLLQRRLKIGYSRAARILDLLEEKGIIGASDGAKPREVFLDALGGVDALEFAAKEHNLTGELKEIPTPTIFKRAEPIEATIINSGNNFEEIAEEDNDENIGSGRLDMRVFDKEQNEEAGVITDELAQEEEEVQEEAEEIVEEEVEKIADASEAEEELKTEEAEDEKEEGDMEETEADKILEEAIIKKGIKLPSREIKAVTDDHDDNTVKKESKKSKFDDDEWT